MDGKEAVATNTMVWLEERCATRTIHAVVKHGLLLLPVKLERGGPRH